MESSDVETEIRNKALEPTKLVFAHGFDPDDFNKYIRLLF